MEVVSDLLLYAFIMVSSGKIYWHELSALQLAPVRRSTGNDVSGALFSPFFSLFLFLFFSLSSTFLIKGVLGSKNLFSER